MKRIFIVRHGRTVWNDEQRLQGAHGDSPLLMNDLEQYQSLANYLNQYQFAAVYSSPAHRAVATGERVLQQMSSNLPLQIKPQLLEIGFGQWEGKLRSDLLVQEPKLFAKMSQRIDDPALAKLGMENFQEARNRFEDAITTIAKQMAADENVLVFSHGGISQIGIQTLTDNQHLLGLKNLSTSILAVQQHEFYLDSYNQTGYLAHVDLNEGNVSII